ncbi:MAG TPA: DNA recombination protein RmuC [Verrucomicrobiae bacterium]|nr:DNA recombination protein RmuC [Verrucomicrobiae bacterium]
MTDALAVLTAERDRATAEAATRIAVLETRLDAESQNVVDLRGRLQAFENELASEKSANTLERANLAAMQAQRDEASRLYGSLKERFTTVQGELDGLRTVERATAERFATAAAELAAAQKVLADDERRINAVKNEVAKLFSEEAAKALNERIEVFDRTAEDRRSAIDAMLAPVKEQLGVLGKAVGDFDVAREKGNAQLNEQIAGLLGAQKDVLAKAEAITGAAGELTSILRNPQARGAWGELTLRNVIENAGLSEYDDVELQRTIWGDDGRGRPDALIRIPRSSGKRVAIDAKAPSGFFQEAIQAATEEERAALLRQHTGAILDHVNELARRNYGQYENVIPAVVLFLPNEGMLQAALGVMPDLYVRAREKSVIITTPLLFSVILEAFAAGWQQERQEANAARIAESARKLYRYLAKFAEHFTIVGRRIQQTVEAYNGAVGSYQGRVLVAARRMDELGGAEPADRPLVEGLQQRDVSVRELAPDSATIEPVDDDQDAGTALTLRFEDEDL